MRTASRIALLVATLAVCAAPAVYGQTASGPEKCDADVRQSDAAWATSSHSVVASTLHTESDDLHRTWCRLLKATDGLDRGHKAEDFVRVLFTTDGIRPAFGVAAQNAGPGGGVAFDMSPTSAAARFGISSSLRGSTSGSWDAGAMITIVGVNARGEAGHAYGSLEVQHVAATQRVSFVEGPSGATETHFRLDQTTARGVYHTHEFGGASVFGEAGVSAFSPGRSTDAPSTDTIVTDATVPGLSTSTTYGVFGFGMNWHYPVDEHIAGYSTQLSSSLRFFQGSSGYSFRRADITWAHQYTPDTDADLGTFSWTGRLITTTAASGSRVPFYLQPALGGNDIEHDASLRSYEYGRFRAPDTLAAQAEYTRTVWGPLALLLFVDAGASGNALSSVGPWRHSEGIGIVVRAGGQAFARAYFAWGGGQSRGSGGADSSKTWLDGAQRGMY